MPSAVDNTELDRQPGRGGETHAEVGMEINGRYRLLSRRGRGGIGEVWEAELIGRGRKVALKLLLPVWRTDNKVRKRFVREGRLAGTMRHRHIIDVLDVGETDDGLPFIAMELLHGTALDIVVQEHGRMPWERVKRIVLQLCSALDHAHNLKIVHRDVKPANVMLETSPSGGDWCKLVDFGIAKQHLVHLKTQHLTGEGQMIGSPGYMSPEQLQGKPTDVRGDIYGLGCTAFYLLTGDVPFSGDSMPELIHNALYTEPRSLAAIDLDPSLRQDIEAVLHRAVRKEPSDRFDSALDFVVALNNVGRPQVMNTLIPSRVPTDPASDSPPSVTLDGKASAAASADTREDAIAASPASMIPPSEEALRMASEDETRPGAKPSSYAFPDTAPSRGANHARQYYSWVISGRPAFDRAGWGTSQGFVEIARTLGNAIIVHMGGLIEPGAARLFDRSLGPLLKSNPPSHVFWHLAAARSYPADVREASLRCLADHRERIKSVHVLNSPGLVGLAVSLANMVLGGKINVHEDELAWRAALDAQATAR